MECVRNASSNDTGFLNMIELSPSQIAALKLAKDGDLYPQPSSRWTHQNATVTYAKSDRWKERPQKAKSVTAKALDELDGFGFLERRHLDDDRAKDVYGITMAGKVWLLKNK
ncbi:conserved hypothetical protein [Rhizobium mesoamericanum STM3625]|uniref:Uncharacterized protein n=2 Tax=Rhizobium mesoamericanum TaxID=1079800 RepID=K0PTM1_9HYPH|nr:conserved hypothetical protein [Rhizobium mesoamericanum STM3625]